MYLIHFLEHSKLSVLAILLMIIIKILKWGYQQCLTVYVLLNHSIICDLV